MGAGTWGRGDSGTWGREDFGTQRRAGIRGRDKQITPDFCAELVNRDVSRFSNYGDPFLKHLGVHC